MVTRAGLIMAIAAGAAACGARAGGVARSGSTAAERAICGGPALAEGVGAADRAAARDDLAAYEGAAIMAVELLGAVTLADQLRPGITLRVGDRLDRDRVGAELRRLWQLGVIEDAVARAIDVPGGVRIELEVRERGLVGAVAFDRRGPIADARLRRLRSLAGVIDDPGRIRRSAARLEDELRTTGHWKASVTATRRRGAGAQVAVCVVVAPGPRYVLEAVEFPGASRLARRQLAALIARETGRINAPGGAYRPDLVDADLLRIQAAYFDVGHVEVRVGTPVATVDEARARIRLAIAVTEGPQYRLGAIAVNGADAATTAAYTALLGLVRGDVFSRRVMAAGLERIRAAEREAGRSGSVTPLTSLDVTAATIGVTVEVVP